MVQKKCATCIHYRKPEENQMLGACENSKLWPTGRQCVYPEVHSCENETVGSQWKARLDQPITGNKTQSSYGPTSNGNSPEAGIDKVVEKILNMIRQLIANIVAIQPQEVPSIAVALFCGFVVFLCVLAFIDLFLGIPFFPEITLIVLMLFVGLGVVIWLIRHPDKLKQ